MQKLKPLFLAICVMGFLSITGSAHAAELFFGSHAKEVNVGEKFEVGVFVDTEGQDVNAVGASISFPADYLEFQGTTSGKSKITFWVQAPKSPSKGLITFSGATPGGFQVGRGYLFSLIFKSLKTGSVTINSNNEKIYLNDGNGSLAQSSRAPLALNIVKSGSPQKFLPLYDATPPEPFEPRISQNPNVFDGKNFLIFATQDKGSGIDHYEVMEVGQFGSMAVLFSEKKWAPAESPYLLKDQSLKSVVYVKAVDKSSNEEIAQLEPQNSIGWYESWLTWGILVLAVIILYIFWRVRKPKLWKPIFTKR